MTDSKLERLDDIEKVAKEDFDAIMKRIAPFIPQKTETEFTTIGKWECSKNHREKNSTYPHSYSV